MLHVHAVIPCCQQVQGVCWQHGRAAWQSCCCLSCLGGTRWMRPNLYLEAYQTVFKLAMLYAVCATKTSLLFAGRLTNAGDWAASTEASHAHAHVLCLLQLVPLSFDVELLCSSTCRMTRRTGQCCHSTTKTDSEKHTESIGLVFCFDCIHLIFERCQLLEVCSAAMVTRNLWLTTLPGCPGCWNCLLMSSQALQSLWWAHRFTPIQHHVQNQTVIHANLGAITCCSELQKALKAKWPPKYSESKCLRSIRI